MLARFFPSSSPFFSALRSVPREFRSLFAALPDTHRDNVSLSAARARVRVVCPKRLRKFNLEQASEKIKRKKKTKEKLTNFARNENNRRGRVYSGWIRAQANGSGCRTSLQNALNRVRLTKLWRARLLAPRCIITMFERQSFSGLYGTVWL